MSTVVINSLDPFCKMLLNSGVEYKGSPTESLSAWKRDLRSYSSIYVILLNSKYLLNVSIRQEVVVHGIFDTEEGKGYFTELNIGDFNRLFGETFTQIPADRITINNRLAFPKVSNKIKCIEDLSRELVVKMAATPEFLSWGEKAMVVRAIRIAQEYVENSADVQLLYQSKEE
ncbi:hypothetical protein [Escherichia phage EP_H11]|nr:hypothetical protein [Escherichia phage EP_H11]